MTTHQHDPPAGPHSTPAEQIDASRTVVLRWRDPGALQRQAEYRRRHKHPSEMCGTGGRAGSWRAMARINRVLVVCGEPGCATLNAYARVLRDTHAARRATIELRDGCAVCRRSRWHRAARHAATQRRWAAELRCGERLLVRRPTHVEQEVAARVVDNALAGAVAAAMAMLGQRRS